MDGFDIMPDGAPPEEPEMSAETAYQNIPAPLSQALGEQVDSTVRQIGRVAQQGQYEGSSGLAQWLRGALVTSPEVETTGTPVSPAPGTVPTPMLSPDDYNARYAPNGPDGKPVSLGSEPMPEGVAKLVGDAKREEIERENVTARYENAHSWPSNFATDVLGFMLDPLRAATAFIPGVGEETILARLGGGIAARAAARIGAGATTGTAAQLPLSALQYGLGQEEASDYGLRDAFRDVAFAAAGNAIFHTGLGTASDILRGRTAEPALEAQEAAPILAADAQTQHAAMSSAVAELADGRPVDVTPMFQLKTPEPIEGFQFLPPPPRPIRPSDVAVEQRALYHDGFSSGVPGPELRQTSADIYAPEEPEVEPDAVEREKQETAAEEPEQQPQAAPAAGFTTAKGSTYELHEDGTTTRNKSYHPEHGREDVGPQPRSETTFYVTQEQANQLGLIQAQNLPASAIEPLQDGRWGLRYLEGKDAGKFESRTVTDVESQPARGLIPVELWNNGRRVHFGNEITEVHEAAQPDPEIAAAEQRMETIGQDLLPEERAELEQVHNGIAMAEAKSTAYDEAAACLKEAGL